MKNLTEEFIKMILAFVVGTILLITWPIILTYGWLKTLFSHKENDSIKVGLTKEYVLLVGVFVIFLTIIYFTEIASKTLTPKINSVESFIVNKTKSLFDIGEKNINNNLYNDNTELDKVIYLKKIFNQYSQNEYSLKDSLSYESQDIASMKCGLKSFDKSYFQDTFSVISIEPHIAGGVNIYINFTNSPDKIFEAWVYGENSNFDLRTFCDLGIEEENTDDIVNPFSTNL